MAKIKVGIAGCLGRMGQELTKQILEDKNLYVDHVIQIHVEENLLLERINKRASENKNVRKDDNSEILANRLIVYNQQTIPVLKHYEKMNKLKKMATQQSGLQHK